MKAVFNKSADKRRKSILSNTIQSDGDFTSQDLSSPSKSVSPMKMSSPSKSFATDKAVISNTPDKFLSPIPKKKKLLKMKT